MYLTAQRTKVYEGPKAEPILTFLYEHNERLPPGPREVEELLGRYNTEGVTLVAQDKQGFEMGGNRIVSYLDIVTPNNLAKNWYLKFLRQSAEHMRPSLAGANLPFCYRRNIPDPYYLQKIPEAIWIRFGLGHEKYRLDRNIIDEFDELVEAALLLFHSYDGGDTC